MRTSELVKDITAFTLLLLRLDFDDIVENKTLLVEVINEAGFRTVTGKEFTLQSFNAMICNLSPNTKEEILEEFSDAFVTMNWQGVNIIEANHIFL